jgi:hypothetical protein
MARYGKYVFMSDRLGSHLLSCLKFADGFSKNLPMFGSKETVHAFGRTDKMLSYLFLIYMKGKNVSLEINCPFATFQLQ